jgi:drug/metabolite transporter (DMT)-like permease
VRVNRWNIAVASIAASWGFVSVIVAGIDVSGEGLVFWRCALAALTLALILLAVGRRGALALRRRRLQVLGLGLMLALHWVLFFETIKRSSVAVAILLVYTAPIFLAVFAPFVLPERRSRVTILALAISGPGIALIALGGDEGSHASAVAVATGLGAAVTYAVLIIWTKSVLTAVSPLTIAFWNYVVVSSVLAPVVLLGSARALPTASEWPAVLVLGAVLTAVLGALFVRALRDVTAQAAGLLAYVEPVSAALLAWGILGEPIGWEVAVGGLAVLTGGALVVLLEGAEAPAPDAPLAVAEE